MPLRAHMYVMNFKKIKNFALESGAQNSMWLKNILDFLEVPTVPRVWTDNRGASTLSYNPDFHKRSKHIRLRHYFVREYAEDFFNFFLKNFIPYMWAF